MKVGFSRAGDVWTEGLFERPRWIEGFGGSGEVGVGGHEGVLVGKMEG